MASKKSPSRPSKASRPRPWLGLFAGAAAGLAAAAAMSAMQSLAAKVTPSEDEEGDPATVKAADKAALATVGERVPEPYRAPAGEAVHYLLGAALGGAYGLVTEYKPGASAGFGGAYGVAVALLLDDAAVPAAGLGPAPWNAPLTTHGYGLASHLVFGTVLEGVRGLLAGR